MTTTAMECPRLCGGELRFDNAGEITGCSSGCSLYLILNPAKGNGSQHAAPATVTAHSGAAVVRNLPSMGELLDALAGFVRGFVAMNEEQAAATALWVVHTHAFGVADATPYLSIGSPEKASGKTRLLEVLELLVARPWLTGKTTAAVLPRKIDAETPTLLLDESDAAFKGDREYAEALRGVLNSGYRRSGKATVCVGQGTEITFKDFRTYCPKAIAGLGRLPDTVEDRAIPIELKKRRRDEPVARFRQRDAAHEAAPLRDTLALSVDAILPELVGASPELPDQLGDRAQDVWEPLLAIADLAGGAWPAMARAAAPELSGQGARDDGSIGVVLLGDIERAFDKRGVDRLATGELLDELHAMEESPWPEWGRSRKPMSGHALAKLLRPYGSGRTQTEGRAATSAVSSRTPSPATSPPKCQSVRNPHCKAEKSPIRSVSPIRQLTLANRPQTRSQSGNLTL